MSKTLNYRSLSCSRFTNKNRIVLSSSTQNLKNTPYFIITTNHWIKFTSPCLFYQVCSIFLKSLICIFTRLTRHLLTVPKFLNSLSKSILSKPHLLHHLRHTAINEQQCEHDRFERHVFVTHIFRQTNRLLQHLICFPAQIGFSPTHFRFRNSFAHNHIIHELGIKSKFLKNEVGYIFTNLQHSSHQMGWFNHLLSVLIHKINSFLHSLLCLNRKVVEIHN